ncbi:MAG: NAD-binding protein, partial [Candidatus Levyibacteriota bacterium]
MEDNVFLIKAVHEVSKKPKVVVMAYDIEEANILYDEGADYVVLPHLAGGRQIVRSLKKDELDGLDDLREKDKKVLEEGI